MRVIGEGPIAIMANVEIEQAVAVEVAERGAGAPVLFAVVTEARLGRDILELAVIIAEQRHAAIARDEQVGPAVVIVVANRNAVSIELDAVEADFGRDITELPVTFVAVEFARMAEDFLIGPEVATACYEDVEQTIPVVVNERDAAAQRLGHRILFRLFAVAVSEVDAGLGGDIREDSCW